MQTKKLKTMKEKGTIISYPPPSRPSLGPGKAGHRSTRARSFVVRLVPAEVAHIAELARADEMAGGKDEAEEEAQTGGCDVCQTEERVATTNPADCAEYHRFCAMEHRNGVVYERKTSQPAASMRFKPQNLLLTVVDTDQVTAGGHRLSVLAFVELAEGGQTCCAHPDHKVLVVGGIKDGRVVVAVGEAKFASRAAPVGWRDSLAAVVRRRLVLVLLPWPDDTLL